MRHSKIKNSAIIFELLLRKLTSDTINGVENSSALSIIREFFNKKTAVGKEYELYQTIIQNKFSTEVKATLLLEQVLAARKTLNEKKLRKEKYGIVKKLKETYDIEEFFDTKLDLYKEYASIYKLFECTDEDKPESILKEKITILEHAVTIPKEKSKDTLLETFEKEHKDIRLIAYKFLIDKFNKKYSSQLDINQRELLKEYIYNISNTNELLEYVKKTVIPIKKELTEQLHRVDDKVTQIKLQETISMLDKFDNVKFIKDGDILSLLRYYELIKEIKEAENE